MWHVYGVWLRWMQLMCVLPEQKGVHDVIWFGVCVPHTGVLHSLMPSPDWGLCVGDPKEKGN